MTITHQIVLLSSAEFWLFLTLAVVLSAAGLYFGFRYLSRARVIEDTPTAKIRSAQQGYVELAGRAQALEDQPMQGPLSNADCCWYRYKIEKRGAKNWRTLEQKTSETPFLLRDGTGDCVIEPKGAEVSAGNRRVWHGDSRHPSTSPPKPVSGLFNVQLSFGGRYRYSEELIRPGDRVYALGTFSSWGEIEHKREHKALTGDLLRRWKQDKAGLLARFDRDRDGQIDATEWQAARRSAHDQAAYRQRQASPRRQPHRLAKTGAARRPFLLSTVPQSRLAQRFRWWSGGALGLFFSAGSLAIWMFITRLSE